jgi:HD-GYP domain-containing protein (c-di-GMP phosphodiesterase class II)
MVIGPIRFLSAFGQALSTIGLYQEGHPARERAVSQAYDRVRELQRSEPQASFSFLNDEVVYNERPLRELKGWEWSDRLSQVGIQRLEFFDPVDRDDFNALIAEAMLRLNPATVDPRHTERMEYRTIKFGVLGIRGDTEQFLKEPIPLVNLPISINEEVESIDWIHDQVEGGGPLPAAEVEAVVSSLSVAMHGESEIMLPLLQLKDFDQYTTAHAMNVSVLSMGLAEFLGNGVRDVRAIGVAGLLRDMGMTRVPKEIVQKAGPPTEKEWEVIRQHPVEGARIILASEPQLDLAAVVAYEHHMLPGGTGYPTPHFARDCHYASRIVQVCDVYDALRTRRFHRGAWTPDAALRFVETRAGTSFDEEIAQAFVAMMRQLERRIVAVDDRSAIISTAA